MPDMQLPIMASIRNIGGSNLWFALEFNSRKIPRERSVEKWIRRRPAPVGILRSDVL